MKTMFATRCLLALAAAGALGWGAAPARAGVIYNVTYKNNTGQAADDFHIEVDDGGRPTRMVKAQVPDKGTTKGWESGMTGDTAHFLAKPNGQEVGAGQNGTFGFAHEANFIRIKCAYWTVGGEPVKDENGEIIKAELIGQPKITEHDYQFDSNGAVLLDPLSALPVNYRTLLVRSNVPLPLLEALADINRFGTLSFGDLDALPGTTLFRDADGGSFTGRQSYSGPALAPGTGSFIYITGHDGTAAFVLSDAHIVPEPSAVVLFGTGAAGLLGYGWRRRNRKTLG